MLFTFWQGIQLSEQISMSSCLAVLPVERAESETAGFEGMANEVVGMRGGHKITSAPPAVPFLGEKLTASETPEVAMDALQFQNLDTEDDVCRICGDRGDSLQQPLLQHCACKGSLGYVHKDCLKLWLEVRRARQCEICKHDYPFTIPIFPDPPDENPFLTNLDFRFWLIQILWCILNYIALVGCTAPTGRSWFREGLRGSTYFFLAYTAAYPLWRSLVFYLKGADYAEDPFVADMLAGRDVRGAALNYLLPSNLFGDGLGDIGGTTFDNLLPRKVYNIAIHIGVAAYDYVDDFVESRLQSLEDDFVELDADVYLGDPVGFAESEVLIRAFYNFYCDRKPWKIICTILCIPLLETVFFTSSYWYMNVHS